MTATMRTRRERAAEGSQNNAPSVTLTLRATGRKWLFWLTAGLCAIVVSLISAMIVTGADSQGLSLAADNPAPGGGMAVVEVLRQQGVTVTVARTLGEARAAAADSHDSTLFFYDEEGYLGDQQLHAVAQLATRTVVADPDFQALRTLAPGVRFGGVALEEDSAEARCDLPAAANAGTLSPGGGTLTLPDASADVSSAPGATWTGCFPRGNDAFSVIERAEGRQTLTLVAPKEVFTNGSASTYGNGALALNLLGVGDSLVWYLPSLEDVASTGPPPLGELTPGWVTPTLLLLSIVVVAAAVWRGRRFGPLVAENLPVIVPAGETMEGRARLYARSSSRLRALDALRIGAVQRLARATGLSRAASLDQVVQTVAEVTGWTTSDVRSVLVDAVPTTDRDLIASSDRLQHLERATADALNSFSQGRMDT
ncbi:MAG: hypothetical protein JWQ68_1678 [Cryobacterium sp.]|jgi:hypothetical protein|nr:hypothetical protein [Cryobacterium sp.]